MKMTRDSKGRFTKTVGKVQVICQQCGKKIWAYAHANRKYCSKQCFNNKNKRGSTKYCENCEKQFYAPLNRLKKGWGRFCSIECLKAKCLKHFRVGNIPWNKGKKGVYSKQYIQKLSEAHKGKRLSIEHRQKISMALKANPPKTIFKKGHKPKTMFKKGQKPWWKLKGLPPPSTTPQVRKKIAHKIREAYRLGKTIGMRGKSHSEETKRKISVKCKEFYKKHPEVREKLREIGKLYGPKGKKFFINSETLNDLYWDKKLSLKEIAKIHKCSITTIYFTMREFGIPRRKFREIRRTMHIPKHRTKPEIRFLNICKKYHLPFKYTGNGSFWIGYPPINPDFIHNNGEKTAIEIFGDYWHSPLFNRAIKYVQLLKVRENILKKYGWKLIVFWESEIMSKKGEKIVLKRLSGREVRNEQVRPF